MDGWIGGVRVDRVSQVDLRMQSMHSVRSGLREHHCIV